MANHKVMEKDKISLFCFSKKSVHPLDVSALIPCQVKVFLDVGIKMNRILEVLWGRQMDIGV